MIMPAQEILDRLDQVKAVGDKKWLALCPAHKEKTPSLNIQELNDGRILMHCFGCADTQAIMEAIGLGLSDLFPEALEERIQPLYMARQEKVQQDNQEDEIKSCELRLQLAKEMREKNERLTREDLAAERRAFLRMKELKSA